MILHEIIWKIIVCGSYWRRFKSEGSGTQRCEMLIISARDLYSLSKAFQQDSASLQWDYMDEWEGMSPQ